MRLPLILLAGFGVAGGVGWLFKFSYETDWLAGLILSATFYLSLQVDELYMLAAYNFGNINRQIEDRQPKIPQHYKEP